MLIRIVLLVALLAAVAIAAYATGWLGGEVDEANAPCVSRTFEGSSFTVCLYDARRHDIALEWADASGAPYRSFERYEQDRGSARVRFAMNAGMFHDDASPVGLYESDGKMVRALNTAAGTGDDNFTLKPNGVFFGDERGVGIATTEAFAARNRAVRFATQSGPMLVIQGQLHPKFSADGPSRYVRNGVGARNSQTAFFVISEDEVSFGKFARFFRDVLHCNDALFLDGNVSSLWVPSQGRRDDAHLFGPMIVVRDRDSGQR